MSEQIKDEKYYNKISEKIEAENAEKQKQKQKFQDEIEHWSESPLAQKWRQNENNKI